RQIERRLRSKRGTAAEQPPEVGLPRSKNTLGIVAANRAITEAQRARGVRICIGAEQFVACLFQFVAGTEDRRVDLYFVEFRHATVHRIDIAREHNEWIGRRRNGGDTTVEE